MSTVDGLTPQQQQQITGDFGNINPGTTPYTNTGPPNPITFPISTGWGILIMVTVATLLSNSRAAPYSTGILGIAVIYQLNGALGGNKSKSNPNSAGSVTSRAQKALKKLVPSKGGKP